MRRVVSYFSFIAFFSAASAFLVIYVDSSMAQALVGHGGILPLFAAAALISICLFFVAPTLLHHLGNSLLFFCLAVIQGTSLLTLALNPGALVGVLALVIHIATWGTLGYTLDLFLEKAIVLEGVTGKIRGAFLTAGNIALVVSPFIAGTILQTHTLSFMYGVAFIVFCFFILITLPMLERFADTTYTHLSFLGIKNGLHGPLGFVILCQFILRIFFSWMAILLPLYLHETLGFSWQLIGGILTFSLLPFALFEGPLGYLTDRLLVVRPIVIAGFFIIGSATALLALQSAPLVSVVILLLFISRIGAAMVEIGTETYFFKQVTSTNDDLIMLFRIAQPFGYLFGTIFASIFLLFTTLQGAFLLFGILMIFGCASGLYLRPLKQQDAISGFCRQSNLRC